MMFKPTSSNSLVYQGRSLHDTQRIAVHQSHPKMLPYNAMVSVHLVRGDYEVKSALSEEVQPTLARISLLRFGGSLR